MDLNSTASTSSSSRSDSSSSSALEEALTRWKEIEEIEVLSADDAQTRYGTDTTSAQRRLGGAVRVFNSASVVPIVKVAASLAVALSPISTGHNWGYGTALPAHDHCVIVDLSPLQRIVDFDSELGVVTVEPGVTQAMLADFLEAGNHPYLVPTNGAGPNCSLMGNALERGYGIAPHCDHFEAVTDLEAVLADGTIYRGVLGEVAGQDLGRLFKWGLGPYSAGLFTQSGFGIVTRMSITLARKPECIKAMFFTLPKDSLLEEAVLCVRKIMSDLPGIVLGIKLMNQHRALSYAAPYPADRVGPDGVLPQDVIQEMSRDYQAHPWTCFGSIYGTTHVVSAAKKHIRKLLAGVAERLIFLDAASAKKIARLAKFLPGKKASQIERSAAVAISSLELLAGKPNETALPLSYWRNPSQPKPGESLDPARDGCGLIWYAPLVPMRPQLLREFMAMTMDKCREHGMEPLVTLTCRNPLLFDCTIPLLFDPKSSEQTQAARACLAALVSEGLKLGVHPYRVGIDGMDELRSRAPNGAAFHRRLREAVDPQGIISPGRYF